MWLNRLPLPAKTDLMGDMARRGIAPGNVLEL